MSEDGSLSRLERQRELDVKFGKGAAIGRWSDPKAPGSKRKSASPQMVTNLLLVLILAVMVGAGIYYFVREHNDAEKAKIDEAEKIIEDTLRLIETQN